MMKKADENNVPIDFVIAWVDGSDEAWLEQKKQYMPQTPDEDDREVRYRDWDNLQYWFRGVEKYTPWVNKIHFVTWGHVPSWLDVTHPKLNIVRHQDYIPSQYLPTFNSHTIELNLHRIEGLAQQFVYFNDDMFINDYMSQEMFFKNGLPCDVFAMDCIYFGKDCAGSFRGNDLGVINHHFKKKEAYAKHFKKWFYPSYGIKCLYKTLALMPWPWFPGFLDQHLPNNYLKSTFEEVWEKESEILDTTCACKIRTTSNVNQWIMKYWQLASGNFVPRKKNVGCCYNIKSGSIDHVIKAIQNGTDKMICINDTSSVEDFEDKKEAIKKAFEMRLGEKSTFEK